MNNTMISIGKYITGRFADFGLASVEDYSPIAKPSSSLQPGDKKLILTTIRTLPDNTKKVPFSNYIAEGVRAERFLTVVQVECKTVNPDATTDFYWNTARSFRDKVFEQLAGQNRGGVVLPRYIWDNPSSPVELGRIWFEVDPTKNSPLEDELEEQDNPNIKSVFLTYNVRWWKPV